MEIRTVKEPCLQMDLLLGDLTLLAIVEMWEGEATLVGLTCLDHGTHLVVMEAVEEVAEVVEAEAEAEAEVEVREVEAMQMQNLRIQLPPVVASSGRMAT